MNKQHRLCKNEHILGVINSKQKKIAEIAEMIVAARNDQGITQGQLAKIAGVSQANISKFETGSSKPNILTLKKIADGLGKRLVVAFVDGEDEE